MDIPNFRLTNPSEIKTTLQEIKPLKPKRVQVKNACVNCQKACKKCDNGRPCQRCIKYNLSDTCRDSVRKERKKGIKRGPYKKREKRVSLNRIMVSESNTLPPNMAPLYPFSNFRSEYNSYSQNSQPSYQNGEYGNSGISTYSTNNNDINVKQEKSTNATSLHESYNRFEYNSKLENDLNARFMRTRLSETIQPSTLKQLDPLNVDIKKKSDFEGYYLNTPNKSVDSISTLNGAGHYIPKRESYLERPSDVNSYRYPQHSNRYGHSYSLSRDDIGKFSAGNYSSYYKRNHYIDNYRRDRRKNLSHGKISFGSTDFDYLNKPGHYVNYSQSSNSTITSPKNGGGVISAFFNSDKSHKPLMFNVSTSHKPKFSYDSKTHYKHPTSHSQKSSVDLSSLELKLRPVDLNISEDKKKVTLPPISAVLSDL